MVCQNVWLCLVAQSCLTLYNPKDCSPPGSSVHGDSPGKNTGVGCHPLLRGSSQSRDRTQVSCHCRNIVYHLSHQGSLLMSKYEINVWQKE